MSETLLADDVARRLLRAAGLPESGCVSVEVDLPRNDLATLVVRYAVTDEIVAGLAEAGGGGVSKAARQLIDAE